VRDNGPGIPPADIARVGERFLRVHRQTPAAGGASPAETEAGGSGLGLAIAQAIALRHGGQLKLSTARDDTLHPGLLVCLSWPAWGNLGSERQLAK